MISLGYPYFASVDTPVQIDEITLKKPVVCLASRFPFSHIQAVQPATEITRQLQLASPFEYSRQPLLARVVMPVIGEIDIYVLHLKSKRPMIDEMLEVGGFPDNLHQDMIGCWASQIQRGSEACQLMAHLLTQRKHENRPTIILGDFNDDLNAEPLKPFHLPKVRQVTDDMATYPLRHFQFHDSWDLYIESQYNPKIPRPYTHYHHTGSVIDYILLSDEFSNSCENNIAQVIDFHCEDQHLLPFETSQCIGSDHAVISISLLISP